MVMNTTKPIQVKSVDQKYPLIGKVTIEPEISIKEALKKMAKIMVF